MSTLYEDPACAVINKAAGLPVLAQSGGIARSVEQSFPHWRPVHRLDNDTSGCLLLAKSDEAYEYLRDQFAAGLIGKRYLAWVHGTTPASGAIDTEMFHHGTKSDRMVLAGSGAPQRGKAQAAHTQFRTVKHQYPNARCPIPLSLLEIEIRTGVRHQIRAHLASISHGIVGDELYGNAKLTIDAPHHLLHAQQLSFTSPHDEQEHVVTAPEPAHFSFA